MTRGPMKLQAKAKNMKKKEEAKKSAAHDQKGACLKSLIYKCSVCMVGSSVVRASHIFF
ncbi:unnamed protein product [Anisakis simplex]|uniref:4F5 domain-containing protein n=1 Tax=Anisakis simplex TaxID=6269 RepID=A0A0M3JBP2_ANISI|nr:unnamed protein product [Anisakis simplex]